MIYTTYFDKLNMLPDSITPIAICLKVPSWYKGLQYKELAPKETFFREWRKNHDNCYYIECFNRQILEQLTIKSVLDDLNALRCKTNHNKNNDIALVCYEAPLEFCHRHLVARWFNQHGVPCTEWDE